MKSGIASLIERSRVQAPPKGWINTAQFARQAGISDRQARTILAAAVASGDIKMVRAKGPGDQVPMSYYG